MLKKKLVKKLLQRLQTIKSLPKLIQIWKKNQRSSRLQSCRTLTRLRLTKSLITLGPQTLIRSKPPRNASSLSKRETKTYRPNTKQRISQRPKSTSSEPGSKRPKMSNTRLNLSAPSGSKNPTKNLTGQTWRALKPRRPTLIHAAKPSKNSFQFSSNVRSSIKAVKSTSQKCLSS